MKKQITYFLFLFISLFIFSKAQAQLNYLPGGFTTSVSTYTDLGTNGSVISVANSDDAFSAALPIGFTFNFNGSPSDSFTFSTNGFIKLGRDTASRHFLFTAHAQPPPNGPFTAATSPAPAANDSNMIFAFGQDLHAGTNASELGILQVAHQVPKYVLFSGKMLKISCKQQLLAHGIPLIFKLNFTKTPMWLKLFMENGMHPLL